MCKSGSEMRRWWIPLASGLLFFLLIAFLIPYSSSVWEVKKSLAGLILAMSKFGTASTNEVCWITRNAFLLRPSSPTWFI